MYFPSDHSVLVEFAKSVDHQFDINVRDFEYLVILACEYKRQDILDYICKSKSIPFNESRLKSLVDLEKNTKKNIKKEKENVPCCFICVEPFNKSTRSVIKCKCDYTSCKTCVKQYLVSQSQDPHCMNCKVEWDQKFMTDNFDSKFISTEFKKYRENILFERELGMMPQTQILVDNEIQIEKFLSEIRKLQIEESIIQDKIKDLYLRIYDINFNKDKLVKREFVRQCPNGECRGFLSTNLKCNICEKWACGDCREVKGDTRDAEHICNPDTVESIKALGKEMKECPKCSYKISKIDGCFAKDTPILMYNGSCKMAQDIKIGDILVGDDGNKRIVQDTVSGLDEMYEIKQNNGDNYIVNNKHTLVLKYCGDKSIYWYIGENLWKIIWFCRETMKRKTKNFKVTEFCTKEQAKQNVEDFKKTLVFPEEIQIIVSDYIKLDKWSKKYLYGFKSNNGINYEYQYVNFDPYMLGLWLGDGTLLTPCIASEDIEIQQYVLDWCENNDCELIHCEGVQFRIRRKGLTNYKDIPRLSISHGSTINTCKGCESRKMKICDSPNILNNNFSGLKTNPFTDFLKQYNLTKEKHIPKIYLQNTRDIRLKVLAGIIDTDGHVPKDQNGKRIVIGLSDKKLFDDTVLLTRSLGFVVNISFKQRKNMSIFGGLPKDYKDQYILNISGKLLNEIPTLLPRKKCFSNNPIVDLYRTNITVVPKGKDNYYGFKVDENNLFVSPDFTVYKNCNQMFCTPEYGGCGTAFDWITLKIETKIHNPHYFDYLRLQNNGQIKRNPNEIVCGRELDGYFITELQLKLNKTKTKNDDTQNILNICRLTIHTNQIDIERFIPTTRENGNVDLRILYMRNKITKDDMKFQIQKREKENKKKHEVSNVIRMFVGCMTDIFYRLLDTPLKYNELLSEMDTLRNYTNNCLLNISKSYKCTCWYYDDNFEWASVKSIKKSKTLETTTIITTQTTTQVN